MKIDPRAFAKSIETVFMIAIVFILGSIILQLGGIWGFFFSFGFPTFSGDLMQIPFEIGAWIVKLVIKLFILGVYLTLCSWIAVYFVNKKK